MFLRNRKAGLSQQQQNQENSFRLRKPKRRREKERKFAAEEKHVIFNDITPSVKNGLNITNNINLDFLTQNSTDQAGTCLRDNETDVGDDGVEYDESDESNDHDEYEEYDEYDESGESDEYTMEDEVNFKQYDENGKTFKF